MHKTLSTNLSQELKEAILKEADSHIRITEDETINTKLSLHLKKTNTQMPNRMFDVSPMSYVSRNLLPTIQTQQSAFTIVNSESNELEAFQKKAFAAIKGHKIKQQ
jgi:hypothetical protein